MPRPPHPRRSTRDGLRELGSTLRGRRGSGRAVLLWSVLGVLCWVAVPAGAPVMVVGAAAVVLVAAALGVTGGGPAALRWLLVVSALVAVLAAGYLWWVFGVVVDAADTFSAPPPAARHSGAVGALFVLSAATSTVAGIVRWVRRAGTTGRA